MFKGKRVFEWNSLILIVNFILTDENFLAIINISYLQSFLNKLFGSSAFLLLFYKCKIYICILGSLSYGY